MSEACRIIAVCINSSQMDMAPSPSPSAALPASPGRERGVAEAAPALMPNTRFNARRSEVGSACRTQIGQRTWRSTASRVPRSAASRQATYTCPSTEAKANTCRRMASEAGTRIAQAGSIRTTSMSSMSPSGDGLTVSFIMIPLWFVTLRPAGRASAQRGREARPRSAPWPRRWPRKSGR